MSGGSESLSDAARRYARLGWKVFRCRPHGKTPATEHGCLDATADEQRVAAEWRAQPDANIGFATGPVFTLDIDGPDGRDSLAQLEGRQGKLPDTVRQRTGRADGGQQLFFRGPAGVEIPNSAGKLGKGIDVRGHHGYSVVPPSIHPTGTAYEWEPGASPWDISVAEAPAKLVALLKAPAASANGNGGGAAEDIPDGQRGDKLYIMARSLKLTGLTQPAILAAVLAENAARCKPPKTEDEVAKIVAHAFEQPDRELVTDFECDPDLSLLNESRRAAPPFPDDVLPRALQKACEEQAQARSAPIDYIVAPLLTAVSGIIGNSRRASPSPTWVEATVISTMAVGVPSSGKSPTAALVKHSLGQLEDHLSESYPAMLREYEAAKLAASVQRDKWEKAARDGSSVEPMPENAVEPECPSCPALCLDDTTIEAAALVHRGAPRGLVLMAEELAGFFGSFDRYASSKGKDRPFWLEAFDGGRKRIDRVKHPIPIIISYLSIAISGGLQPDLLYQVLKGPADGLVARFLYFWPEKIYPARPACVPDDTVINTALFNLLSLEMGIDENGKPAPVRVPLEPGAVDIFYEWRDVLAHREGDASGHFLYWLGKMPGYTLRIALVLELLGWSIELCAAPVTQVSADSVRRAIRLVDSYLVPMAERVFGDAAIPEYERNAATIARLIHARQIGEDSADGVVVNARAIRRKKLPDLRTAAPVGEALSYLVDSGWLRPVPKRDGAHGGRPRADYLVNPAVWGAEDPADTPSPTGDTETVQHTDNEEGVL